MRPGVHGPLQPELDLSPDCIGYLSYKLMPVGGIWVLITKWAGLEMIKYPAQYNLFNKKRCIYFTNGMYLGPEY